MTNIPTGDISKLDQISFTFGDSRELCDQLLALVRSGQKTATCGALRDFTEGGDDLPVIGRRDVALDWDGNPVLLIETTDVTICRFCDVEESFALAEGEGTFDEWRTAHIDFFDRNGGFDPEMELVCERFQLVEVIS